MRIEDIQIGKKDKYGDVICYVKKTGRFINFETLQKSILQKAEDDGFFILEYAISDKGGNPIKFPCLTSREQFYKWGSSCPLNSRGRN